MSLVRKFSVAACVAASVMAISATDSFAKTFKVLLVTLLVVPSGNWAQNSKEELESRLKDKVKLFPNGQLGSEQDTVNDAALGTLDFSILAINNVTPFSPTVGVSRFHT